MIVNQKDLESGGNIQEDCGKNFRFNLDIVISLKWEESRGHGKNSILCNLFSDHVRPLFLARFFFKCNSLTINLYLVCVATIKCNN